MNDYHVIDDAVYNGGALIRTSKLIRTRKIKINSDKNYTYGGFEKSSKHRGAIKSINYFKNKK